MQESKLYMTVKLVSYIVLLSIVVTMGYALVISVTHWPGIGV